MVNGLTQSSSWWSRMVAKLFSLLSILVAFLFGIIETRIFQLLNGAYL